MAYVWKSQAFTLKQQWKRLEASLKRMRLDRCPAIPRDLEEYAAHVAEMATMRAHELNAKLEADQTDLITIARRQRKVAKLFDGLGEWSDGRCGVLGYKTIWVPGWTPEPGRPVVRWPDPQEYKEEGDERHTSNFGRFMPLLRHPGNETVNWKHRPRLREYDMDRVMPVPRKCGVVIPGLYGFDLEVDVAGIPYDDDDVPGGFVAVAAHLDENGDNYQNATVHTIQQIQDFRRKFSEQIFGARGDVPYNLNNILGDNLEEDTNISTVNRVKYNGRRFGNKSENKGMEGFSFNPKASEFVSVLSSPPQSPQEAEISQFEPPTSATPMNVAAIINAVNALTSTYRINQAAEAALKHKRSHSPALQATPGFTCGTSAGEDSEDEMTAQMRATLDQYSFSGHDAGLKMRRGSSFGAIGSERRSSGYTADEGESEVDGGVPLDHASFNTVTAYREEEDVSPMTIPTGFTQLTDDGSVDSQPATLLGLVRVSEPDDGPVTLAELVGYSDPLFG